MSPILTRRGNALQAAAASEDENFVLLLLKYGADVNARGGPNRYALRAARKNVRAAVIDLLLQNGARGEFSQPMSFVNHPGCRPYSPGFIIPIIFIHTQNVSPEDITGIYFFRFVPSTVSEPTWQCTAALGYHRFPSQSIYLSDISYSEPIISHVVTPSN